MRRSNRRLILAATRLVFLSALTLPVIALASTSAHAENIVYPAGANIINVKTEFGATGDGVTDDTAALQAAIINSFYSRRLVYIPNGTYIVSNTLASNNPQDPFNEGWYAYVKIQGQSRAGVIIKLKDSAAGFTDPANPKPVFKYGSEDYGNNYVNGEGNQAFGNGLRNLTVDTGANNTGAIGVDFQGSNFAAVRDITIKTSDATKRGKVGLYLDRRDNGPALVKNVSVDGFDYGVSMRQEISHFTFEFLTLTNQKTAGFYLDGIAAIRKLTSTNTVPAIQVQSNGVLNLIEGTLGGGTSGTSAIALVGAESRALLRDVTATGYARVVTNRGTNVTGTTLNDWTSDPVDSKHSSLLVSLRLPVEETPAYFDSTLTNWASVTDYGATSGNNNDDDAAAIQAALNSGKSTIYFPDGGDYAIGSTLIVPPSVKHIIAVGNKTFLIAKGGVGTMMRFSGGTAANTTVIEQMGMGGDPANGFEQTDARTVVLTDLGTFSKSIWRNNGGGNKLFLDDVAGGDFIFNKPAKVWARNWNNEGYGDPKTQLKTNTDIWGLGVKSEGGESFMSLGSNSRLEIFGGFMYSFGVDFNKALFRNSEGVFTGSFVTQSYSGGPHDLLVSDTRNTLPSQFRKADAIGRGWGSVAPLYASFPGINPTADALVRAGTSAATNFGTNTTLSVRASATTNNINQTYLKFDSTSLTGPIGKAVLRVYGNYTAVSGTASLSAYAVPTTSWTETAINWNNKPALGAKQGSSVVVSTTRQYYDFDVSSYVASERASNRNTVAFAITGDANATSLSNFNSKEASFGKPQLIITAPTTTRLDSGGGAYSGFDDDNTNVPVGNTGTYFTGGAIDVSGVTGAAPQQVYQSERNDLGGGFTYTFGDLTGTTPYKVRLHFAERYFTASGGRVFNVGINGTNVLNNFDIFAAAGAANKAVIREFNATPDANGNITIAFTSVTDRALINGIELLPQISASVPGLFAQYFDDLNFVTPILNRVDPNVDVDWGGGSPDPSIGPDTFSARWTGSVQPSVTGSYQFNTRSDDGIRLWVDGNLVIDNWTDHAPTDNYSTAINLTAGQKYSIKMEYYEAGGGAECRLRWALNGGGFVAIPSANLSTP